MTELDSAPCCYIFYNYFFKAKAIIETEKDGTRLCLYV